MLDFNEARNDGLAVASAGPYANNLHLTSDRQPCQHLIIQFFYRPHTLSGTKPTVPRYAAKMQNKSMKGLIRVAPLKCLKNMPITI